MQDHSIAHFRVHFGSFSRFWHGFSSTLMLIVFIKKTSLLILLEGLLNTHEPQNFTFLTMVNKLLFRCFSLSNQRCRLISDSYFQKCTSLQAGSLVPCPILLAGSQLRLHRPCLSSEPACRLEMHILSCKLNFGNVFKSPTKCMCWFKFYCFKFYCVWLLEKNS